MKENYYLQNILEPTIKDVSLLNVIENTNSHIFFSPIHLFTVLTKDLTLVVLVDPPSQQIPSSFWSMNADGVLQTAQFCRFSDFKMVASYMVCK